MCFFTWRILQRAHLLSVYFLHKMRSVKKSVEEGFAFVFTAKAAAEIADGVVVAQAVMDCLTEECEDPVTHGLLQDRDIYRSLRKNELFDYPPSLDEISGMLDFLASPFIGCVEKVKDGYYSVGTLKDASQKFAYFAAMCRK